MLNSRVGLLCIIACMIGVHYMIEQPSGSLFFDTPVMSAVIDETRALRKHVWMSMFGHPSKKGTLLVGTPTWLSSCGSPATSSTSTEQPPGPSTGGARRKGQGKHAKRPERARGTGAAKTTTTLAIRYVDKKGRLRCTGRKQALKQSQVYPARFALEVVRAHFPDKFV